MTRLTTLDALEEVVGKRPDTAMLKSIPELDQHCMNVLTLSTFGVVGVLGNDGRLSSHLVGGPPGALRPGSPRELRLPRPMGPGYDRPAGLVALVPGWGETLRVNGRLRGDVLAVEEAFLHCAKCILRSRLWGDAEIGRSAETDSSTAQSGLLGSGLGNRAVAGLLERTSFLTIATADDDNRADVSPKGDPAGLVRILDEGEIGIPDRPGNMRRDTFHNILTRPQVSVLALVPGDDAVVEVRGAAMLDDDADLRQAFEVRGGIPPVVLRVQVDQATARRDPAIAAAGLWDTSRHVPRTALPRASQIWTDHVNASLARATTPTIPELREPDLATGLQSDYLRNLY